MFNNAMAIDLTFTDLQLPAENPPPLALQLSRGGDQSHDYTQSVRLHDHQTSGCLLRYFLAVTAAH